MVLQPYDDLVKKLGKPLWWDEVGCPRYEPFTPDLCNNIYATEAALLEIACQSCDERFHVAVSLDPMGAYERKRKLAQSIDEGYLYYGDPPQHEGCAAGYTMSSITIRVVEFWQMQRPSLEWERDKTHEIEFKDEENNVCDKFGHGWDEKDEVWCGSCKQNYPNKYEACKNKTMGNQNKES